MNIWKLITQMVDMRSFSSLWFWMAIAVYWSLSSHWVLGVPQGWGMSRGMGPRETSASISRRVWVAPSVEVEFMRYAM